jgi:hypothetical protein
MSLPHMRRWEREKQASESVQSCHARVGREESLGSTSCAEGCLSPPALRRARRTGDAALDRGG